MKKPFELKFDNNFPPRIEINSHHNADIRIMKSYLLSSIEYFKLRGYNFYNYTELVIETLNDKCNMTYQNYINEPMHAIERQLNIIIAKNPRLTSSFDRNKNHPLIRKYPQIPFNN